MVRETQSAHQKSPAFWYGRMLNKLQQMFPGDANAVNFSNIEDRTLPEQLQLQEVRVDEQGVESTYGFDENDSKAQAHDENDSKAQAHAEIDSKAQAHEENDSKAQAHDKNDSKAEAHDENDIKAQAQDENDSKAQAQDENDSKARAQDENDSNVHPSKIERTRNLEHLKKPTSIRKRRALRIGLIACFASCLLIPLVVGLNHIPGSVAPNNNDVDEDTVIIKDVGDGVKVLVGNTTKTYMTLMSPLAVQEILVCEEMACKEGYKIDQAGHLIFVAGNNTVGNYTVIGYDTKRILKTFQLQLEKPRDQELQKSGAAFNIAPTGLVALVIIIAMITSINCPSY